LGEEDGLSFERIENLCSLIADLRKKYEVILVSSGAVSAGSLLLKLDKTKVENKQAMSAVGQPYLMSIYRKYFKPFDIEVAQPLITADNFDSRKSTAHAKSAVETLLKNGVLPIINENDTTAVKELVFGDNDQLSAHVTYYFDAQMLVILSDIDALYDKDPNRYDDAKRRAVVTDILEEELNAEHTPNNEFATGGIVTKLQSADFLMKHGRDMFLASGFDLSDVKSFLVNGKHLGGTLFKAQKRENEI
jgi:glutamate 5-kinase